MGKTNKNSYKEYHQLDFTNDFLFCKIMTSNLELCRRVLEVILNVSIREVTLAESQKTIDLVSEGHSVRLDVYLNDDKGTIYDLEMQCKVQHNLPKRARYYQGMIDLNMIEKGADYSDLRRTVIIFICLDDPYTKGWYQYNFANTCTNDSGLLMGDEVEYVFLNANGYCGEASDDLKAFLRYLKDGVATTKLCSDISNAVTTALECKEWRTEYMTLMMRDREKFKEGIEEGIKKGIKEGEIKTIVSLVKKGIITSEIGAQQLSCTIDELNQYIKKYTD